MVEKRTQTNSVCTALSYAGTLQAGLRYDPMGRLFETSGPATTRFLYDGDALLVEYDGANAALRRYVHGANPGVDDPIAWFSSSSFTAAATRHLFANQQGSVVLSGDSAGNALRIFAYDEYGVPTTSGGTASLTAANGARFGYTGQAWIPELGMYHYKARVYSPTLGRFMQTDPIGYDDQINLYAYVGNDPVNGSDPTGMAGDCAASGDRGIPNCKPPPPPPDEEESPIVVTAKKVGQVVVEFIPGVDLARCSFGAQSCSGLDWGLAAFDVVPGYGKLGKLAKLRKVGRACGCVVSGTPVSTPNGLRAIESLKVGDLVHAYDLKTGELVDKPVLDVIETEPKPTFNVVLQADSGETARFEATGDHPWLNSVMEWRNTEELIVDEWLVAGDGERFKVVEIGLSGAVETAYTLTVGTHHTYVMGEAGIVVHNAGCPKIEDLKKAGSNKRADEIARRHGFRDAHEAKEGRGDSRVNIYTDKDGNGYLSGGVSPPEPL